MPGGPCFKPADPVLAAVPRPALPQPIAPTAVLKIEHPAGQPVDFDDPTQVHVAATKDPLIQNHVRADEVGIVE